MSRPNLYCPNCHVDEDPDAIVTRRDFMRVSATAGIATAGIAAALSASGPASKVFARCKEPKPDRTDSETLVKQFYESLKAPQKKKVCFGFDDPLRNRVENNWRIVRDVSLSKTFDKDQQDLVKQIFLGMHSERYAETVLQQVEHDNGRGGFGSCSVAMFGEPGSGKFEFVLTGRHVTRRCDGDSVAGAAFGGPIFYGHAAEQFYETADHPGNVYWYQAKRANELYQALDGKQQAKALLGDPRAEQSTKTVALAGKKELPGLRFGDLSADQQELAQLVMSDVLAPFRSADRKETMKLVKANGLENLHFSYYKNMDVGNDKVWDVWQIEGPAMIWHFRGSPHVHTWVHVRDSA